MTIIFNIKAIAALTLLGRAISAHRYADLLKFQFENSETAKRIAEWLIKVDECENTISIEELEDLDVFDLENGVDFS